MKLILILMDKTNKKWLFSVLITAVLSICFWYTIEYFLLKKLNYGDLYNQPIAMNFLNQTISIGIDYPLIINVFAAVLITSIVIHKLFKCYVLQQLNSTAILIVESLISFLFVSLSIALILLFISEGFNAHIMGRLINSNTEKECLRNEYCRVNLIQLDNSKKFKESEYIEYNKLRFEYLSNFETIKYSCTPNSAHYNKSSVDSCIESGIRAIILNPNK